MRELIKIILNVITFFVITIWAMFFATIIIYIIESDTKSLTNLINSIDYEILSITCLLGIYQEIKYKL